MSTPLSLLQGYQGTILPAASTMQLDYSYNVPFNQIYYGLCLDPNVSEYYEKSGQSYESTKGFSGDQYNVHVLGSTDVECLGLIEDLIQIAQQFDGDTDYAKIIPTSLNNIIRNYEDQKPFWRHMSFLLKFARKETELF
jgi:hypothetical protein